MKKIEIGPIILTATLTISMLVVTIVILVLLLGRDPLAALSGIFFGAFGNINALSETFTRFIPILLTSLGVVIAFKCNVWNIGIEGQFWVGACVATGIGITLVEVPGAPLITIMALGSFLGGATWAAIAGFMKVKFGVNEIVATIMLTGIATQLAAYLYEVLWLQPGASEIYSLRIAPQAHLPRLLSSYRVHAGLLIALAAAAVTYVLLTKTTLGYRIRMTGGNEAAARYAGVNVGRSMMTAMILSGGLAGLAGMVEIAGIQFRLRFGVSPGFGFIAVVAALLGGLNPVGVIFSSFFLAVLSIGTDSLQRSVQVPQVVVLLLEGLMVIITLLISYMLNRGRGIKWKTLFSRS